MLEIQNCKEFPSAYYRSQKEFEANSGQLIKKFKQMESNGTFANFYCGACGSAANMHMEPTKGRCVMQANERTLAHFIITKFPGLEKIHVGSVGNTPKGRNPKRIPAECKNAAMTVTHLKQKSNKNFDAILFEIEDIETSDVSALRAAHAALRVAGIALSTCAPIRSTSKNELLIDARHWNALDTMISVGFRDAAIHVPNSRSMGYTAPMFFLYAAK
jgi:hypothetical protein